jgi:DNA-binding NarL/FixJ family response regulator
MRDQREFSTSSDGNLSPVRVIVADDHPVVRFGVVELLSREPDIAVVGEAEDGIGVIRAVQSLLPQVLVLDIVMPGPGAIEVLQRVNQVATPPRTLILTGYPDQEFILTVLKAGATGYVFKDEEPMNICSAVRAVARGKTWLSPLASMHVVDHMVNRREDADEPTLSMREQQVLQLLSEGKENQEIGNILHISVRTVRFHLRNIYDKIGVDRRGEAIAWAIRRQFCQHVPMPLELQLELGS